jgi:hypothetical protein
MAIKRLTIELDDAPDRVSSTTVPESLRPKKARDLKQKELTAIPKEEDTEETSLERPNAPPGKVIGRTPADLVADFVNDPKVMATILMFLPFIPFAPKLDKLADLLLPGAVGVLLNLVWFGVALLKKGDR